MDDFPALHGTQYNRFVLCFKLNYGETGLYIGDKLYSRSKILAKTDKIDNVCIIILQNSIFACCDSNKSFNIRDKIKWIIARYTQELEMMLKTW